jgi:hypothetical protein
MARSVSGRVLRVSAPHRPELPAVALPFHRLEQLVSRRAHPEPQVVPPVQLLMVLSLAVPPVQPVESAHLSPQEQRASPRRARSPQAA